MEIKTESYQITDVILIIKLIFTSQSHGTMNILHNKPHYIEPVRQCQFYSLQIVLFTELIWLFPKTLKNVHQPYGHFVFM